MSNAKLRFTINHKRKTITISDRINGTFYQILDHNGDTLDKSVTYQDDVRAKAKNIVRGIFYRDLTKPRVCGRNSDYHNNNNKKSS